MEEHPRDGQARAKLLAAAAAAGLEVAGGAIRRTSSRFCLGVEHGDYNGTELLGVGTDRFLWLAGKANDSGTIRLLSLNYPAEGILRFTPGATPPPRSPELAHRWARFPLGADHILRREGFPTGRGFDGVLWSDIPGGGMSRSASLALNLVLTSLAINGARPADGFQVAELARAIETDYIGSPCGILDQVMILFARAGMATHYQPGERRVTHLPLGAEAPPFHLVCLDTGSSREGLEHATYPVRRRECEHLVALARQAGFPLEHLGDAYRLGLHEEIRAALAPHHPELCRRLAYLAGAQARLEEMLAAWRRGDLEQVGALFRRDGIGLRDDYRISGPELESMCDIARTVPGVLGERMLGGGDKGTVGAIVRRESLADLERTVALAYPRSHPDRAGSFALHACSVVAGVKVT